jgi:tetratricopeptide (TPR) repeat protein
VADSRIDELRRRLERDPGSRLFAQLAEEHRKAGNHAEAVRVARTGLAQHPSYASARLTLGRALLDSGDAGGARVELEAALRDAPDNILASRFLGQALEALGELGPALLQLQKTLKMAPGDRQLESQIVALQTRLRTPPAAPPPPPAARPAAPELTTPIRPLAAPAAASDAEEGALPATIRIHMPGDPAPGGARRAAAPPLVRTPVAPPPLPSDVRPEVAHPVLAAEPFYESDVAPTQPKAEPSPFFVPEEPPAPTLPGPVAPVEEAVLAEAPSPAEPPAQPLPTPAETGVIPDAAGDEPPPEPHQGAAAVPTPTLAELYLKQGLLEQAIDVYRQVVAAEPANERARGRLVDLVASATAPDSRAARRRALERTIAGLEALLAAVRTPR